MTAMLGEGVYSWAEAADLTGLSVGRVRAWLRGRPRRVRRSVQADPRVANLLTFLDLIDVLVVGRLLEAGHSLETIRGVAIHLAGLLSTPHPFAHRDLLTDGQRLLTGAAEHVKGRRHLDAVRRLHALPKRLLPYLRQIEYDAQTRLASRWHIVDGVVIDPAIRFGKPVVQASGIATSILAAAYRANRRDADAVADWYGVSPVDVELAVNFESRTFRAAA